MDPEIREMCQENLGKNAKILTDEETQSVCRQFKQCFPIAYEGRIDCTYMKYCEHIDDIHQSQHVLWSQLGEYPSLIYILWNDMDLPAAQIELKDVIYHFRNISQLAFDVWFCNFNAGYVIESHHSFGITVGVHYNRY